MPRQIVSMEEQDAYTGWRKVMFWQPGERKGVKRRTHQRERRVARTGVRAELSDLLSPELFEPLRDLSDCRHGCNGDCENWGARNGEGRCDFTCHDRRCENCTAPCENWLSTGWFCNYECAAEYDRALMRGIRGT